MGIYYQVEIKCLKVKDLNLVDFNVLSDDDTLSDVEIIKKFQAYYDASKKNTEKILVQYMHDPVRKYSYMMTEICVPEETNIIAFDNNATDRQGNIIYSLAFVSPYGQFLEKKLIKSTSERNCFMVIVPPKTFSIMYGMAPEAFTASHSLGAYSHSFGLGPQCLYCNNEKNKQNDSDSD